MTQQDHRDGDGHIHQAPDPHIANRLQLPQIARILTGHPGVRGAHPELELNPRCS